MENSAAFKTRESAAASGTIQNGAEQRMSLKAKLEAVIYAAEEPVTLAQLAMLFADEAMEWKAEQAAAQTKAGEPAGAEAESSEPVQEPLPEIEAALESASGTAAEKPGEGAGEAGSVGLETGGTSVEAGGAGSEPGGTLEAAQEAVSEDGAAPQEAVEPYAAQIEADAKRAAKLFDREARGVLKHLLDELIAEYAVDGRGVEIREIAGGYRMATKPECHDAVRAFIKGQKPPLKLSLPALETLAVIAYKQPVTAPEVNEIRGVDSSGVFGSLLARKLIATAGRKQVVGRPILYKTTREFLLRFGLKDIAELPSMEEFEKMAASELEEPEVAGASAAAEPAEFNPDLSVESNENGADAGHQAEPAAESEPNSEPVAETESVAEAAEAVPDAPTSDAE